MLDNGLTVGKQGKTIVFHEESHGNSGKGPTSFELSNEPLSKEVHAHE